MPREFEVPRDYSPILCTRESGHPWSDREVGALAGRQHGIVAAWQLRERGIPEHVIRHRVRSRHLLPCHRGVYAVGHGRLTRSGSFMAAVLAGGPDAVLGHRSGAAHWGLRIAATAVVEIIVPRRIASRPGVRVRHAALLPDEVCVEDGIPVTTPARTLFDLATVLDRHRLERAVHEAEVLRLLSPASLPVLLERHPGRRGAKHLRAILDDLRGRGATVTKSELENRFLSVVAKAGLPRPEVNADVPTALRAYEVDATWPAARLAVELDGGAAHHTRRAFEEDRLRDRALAVAGWRTIRITWHELRTHPDRVAADLQGLLSMPDLPAATIRSQPIARPKPARLNSDTPPGTTGFDVVEPWGWSRAEVPAGLVKQPGKPYVRTLTSTPSPLSH